MALPSAASVVSTGLASYPTIYYDRVALDTLQSNLFMYPACTLRTMPDRSGTNMQIFNYTAFGPNTTPATEGTPGTGEALTQNTKILSLSQYVDYISYSDKAVLTTISDIVTEGSQQLAYRGALSVDTVISNAVNTVSAGDTTTQINNPVGSYMSASLSRKAAMQLRSLNVKPQKGGKFFGIINSLAGFDLINDASAGGFIDMEKHIQSGVKLLEDGVNADNFIAGVGGVEWYESNSLPFVTDYSSGTANGYEAFVFGNQAFIASSLGKTNLGQRNFSVKTSRFTQPIALDPANQIAAASSYNFYFGVVNFPGPANAFRKITTNSSIG
jgi:N4-gp56 family major capsid protein